MTLCLILITKSDFCSLFNVFCGQDVSRAGRFPSDVAETTEDLLNRSHSLRYGLQVLERERRGTAQLPPFTTPYPIL